MSDSAGRSTSSGPGSSGTEAAERVADVLLAFSRSQSSSGVSKLARELSLSKAVVHRILQSLVSRGLVKYDQPSRTYRLGPSAAALGAQALRQLDLRTVAQDELVRLRDATSETTTLSILAIDRRAYIEQFESPQSIKMSVELGQLYPLHAGASSRAILAFLPDEDVERIIGTGLDPMTPSTILDPDELRRGLEEVRRNGFAVSHGERQAGAGSVAAPVFGAEDQVLGSISVCGPLARFDDDAMIRYQPMVISAARKISALLHTTPANPH